MLRFTAGLIVFLVLFPCPGDAFALDPMFNSRVDFDAGGDPVCIFAADLDSDTDFANQLLRTSDTPTFDGLISLIRLKSFYNEHI